MKTRMLTIRGIAVQITERENCRRFILRSRPDCPYAMLSVPKRSREADIRRFLENQQEWLQAHVGAVKNPPTFTPGEVHRLMGAWVTLGKDVPSGAAFVEMRNERLIREIERDIAKWASTLHVRITHVTLREMTSRWGSCRKQTQRLTFNTRLGGADESMIEYVVVHELCHLIYPDHSAPYYTPKSGKSYAESSRNTGFYEKIKRRRQKNAAFALTSRTECDIMKRGDVYQANLDPVIGSEQGGIRPVVIIQNDRGNRYSPTVIVVAVTTRRKKPQLPVHVLLTREESGLKEDSIVLTEQVRTLEKTRLTRYLGTVTAQAMKRIDRALGMSIGST